MGSAVFPDGLVKFAVRGVSPVFGLVIDGSLSFLAGLFERNVISRQGQAARIIGKTSLFFSVFGGSMNYGE